MFKNEYIPHFGGHQTFALRHTWIPKALQLVMKNPSILFNPEETMTQMGIGKNMALSVRHWLESSRIVERCSPKEKIEEWYHSPTDIARIAFGNGAANSDVYIERIETIWLLHWLICSNHFKNAVWAFVFNFLSSIEFSRESLTEQIEQWLRHNELPMPSDKTLKNDINTFLSMYSYSSIKADKDLQAVLSSPLKELNLISYSASRMIFHINRTNSNSIADDIVSFCILDYLESIGHPSTISFDELYFKPFSPGKVLQLSEEAMVYHLNKFSLLSNHTYRFDTTAGVKQLLRVGSINTNKHDILMRLYG